MDIYEGFIVQVIVNSLYIYDYIMCELFVVGIFFVYWKMGYVFCYMIFSYLLIFLLFFLRSIVWIFKFELVLSK